MPRAEIIVGEEIGTQDAASFPIQVERNEFMDVIEDAGEFVDDVPVALNLGAQSVSDVQGPSAIQQKDGESLHKRTLANRIKAIFSVPWKKTTAVPQPSPAPPRREEMKEETNMVSVIRPLQLPPKRLSHSAVTLVSRELDVRSEILESLVKEHAQLRMNLSLGLAGLHGMSCLVAQEEARQMWLKEAIVVEREAIAAITILKDLDRVMRQRLVRLEQMIDEGTSFMLQVQAIAKAPKARAGIADQVHALLPDMTLEGLELPDLHSMFMLLKAWENNKKGFILSSDNNGGTFKNPTEMMQLAEKLLQEVLDTRGLDKKLLLTQLLKDSSHIVNRRRREKSSDKQEQDVQLISLARDVEKLDATLQNLHDEQYHLENHLDRALESQWQYRELLIGKSHENQVLQMQLQGMRNSTSELSAYVHASANSMDKVREKEESASRCNAAVNGLRRIVRDTKALRTSANVELQVMATVAAGLQGTAVVGHMTTNLSNSLFTTFNTIN